MIGARVTDAAALNARTPTELSMYLRSAGWGLTRREGSVAYWTLQAGEEGEFEVLQPLDPRSRDYAARVGDAVATLAIAEGRSELDILRTITDVSVDVHTIHLFPADEPPGMIAIEDGVRAYESLRGLVVASAYPIFANQHRAVQPARKPQGLADFMRTVRIGPGAEGSYALTVYAPVPPRLSGQPTLFDGAEVERPDDEPVERQVSLRMYEAIQAAHEAADAALLTTDGLTLFTEAVPRGLSANLCEALVGLGGDAGHSFEISMSFAPIRPLRFTPSPISFRRDHVPVLREAADELRARTPEEDVAVTGEVVRLHREGHGTGEITLVGHVEDQDPLRRIWIELPAEEYTLAMQAHKEMRGVTVRGSLVRRGTRYYLGNPAGFRILSATAPD